MANSATIYLVRHGEAEDESEDPGLSATGTVQARALAGGLQAGDISLIAHSPRRRAVETADVLAAAMPGVERAAFEFLNDRTPFPSAGRRAEYSERFLRWLDEVPDGERDIDGALIHSALDELANLARARSHRGAVIAVTHNFVIAGMLSRVLDAPAPLWSKFDSANTGVSRIDCGQAAMKLVSFNETFG